MRTKGKVAYAKARHSYKELAKRNATQAATIANMTREVVARENGCDARERMLRDQASDYAARFGWGPWRRLVFLVTGR
jgi:hypothetical protein